MESLSLSKLNLYLRRVVALNFQDSIWVTAEVLSLKKKNGHIYIELSEKDENDAITAQNSAIIWLSSYTSIQNNQQSDLFDILKEGNEIRILVNVDYNPRFGLKLIVQNIDSEFTYGKIAQSRILTIKKLKDENLWQKNQGCELPIIAKRIAVIASKESAGFIDFEHQIKENVYQYVFELVVFDVTVQGKNSIPQIVKSIEVINNGKREFDLIVLIRGGGAKLDLLDFDSYLIAREISTSKIPVLTGIGHYIDESIADLSAFKSLKTPTAVAEYIISIHRDSENILMNLIQSIVLNGKEIIDIEKNKISNINKEIRAKLGRYTYKELKSILDLNYMISKKTFQMYNFEFKKLTEIEINVELNDPNTAFQKGYSMTYIDNVLIGKCKNILINDELKTYFSNGVITSKVTKS